VFNPLQMNAPIVAVNDRFCKMLHAPQVTFVGATYVELLRDLPQWAISQSAKENFASFCTMCGNGDVSSIGETCLVQAFGRSDGSLFMGYLSLSLCVVQGMRFVIGALLEAGDVTLRLSSAKQAQLAELVQDILRRACARSVYRSHQYCVTTHEDNSDVCGCKASSSEQRGGAFFGSRLSEYAVLLHGGRTAMRREPDQVANGCLVFGSQPVQLTLRGLSFAVQVVGVSSRFKSLPSIGITRRKPTSNMPLPRVAKCLAESVFIGGVGEASARDQESNFQMGFRAPPPSELMNLSSQLPEDLKLNEGDILECIYTNEGRIQLLLNSKMLLDFDVERPLDKHASYYPVVDVSGAASILSLLPASSDFATVGDLSTCIPDECELLDTDEEEVSRQMSCQSLLTSFCDRAIGPHFAEEEEFSLAMENAAPVAGLAGILVLSVMGQWHNSLGRIVGGDGEAYGKPPPTHQTP